MHAEQKRESGEPYVTHPLNVALIIAQLKLDVPSIVTGLLHDVVEDTQRLAGRGAAHCSAPRSRSWSTA